VLVLVQARTHSHLVRVYADEFSLSLGLVCDYQVTCWRMILAGHVVECQLDSFIT
jgi:hypothetical protein